MLGLARKTSLVTASFLAALVPYGPVQRHRNFFLAGETREAINAEVYVTLIGQETIAAIIEIGTLGVVPIAIDVDPEGPEFVGNDRFAAAEAAAGAIGDVPGAVAHRQAPGLEPRDRVVEVSDGVAADRHELVPGAGEPVGLAKPDARGEACPVAAILGVAVTGYKVIGDHQALEKPDLVDIDVTAVKDGLGRVG